MIGWDTATKDRVKSFQKAGHGITAQIDARGPGQTVWHPLQVVDATVTIAPAGDAPTRSLAGTVLVADPDGTPIIPVHWSPYGTWLRASQTITLPDGSIFLVPYGVFRLDSYKVDEISGAIDFEAADAFGSQIDGYDLVTIRDQQVDAKEMYSTRLTYMLTEGMNHIEPWWPSGKLMDFSASIPSAEMARTAGRMYLTQELSRTVSATKLATQMSSRVICPADLTSCFKVIPGRSPTDVNVTPSSKVDHVITTGMFGNLLSDGYSDMVDRRDYANTIVLTYEEIVDLPDGKQRHTPKRVVVTYDDTDATTGRPEELSSTGPFGIQTREAITADALSLASAKANAAAVMANTWYEGRDVTFTCSPIYGLESGDMVWVVPHLNAIGFGGQLLTATCPLMAEGGAWTLTIKVFKQLDPSWTTPHYLFQNAWTDDVTEIEDANWEPLPTRVVSGANLRVGLDTDYPAGWHHGGVSSAFVGKDKDSLTVDVGGSGTVTIYTDRAWDVESMRRYQVKASLDNDAGGAISARIGIDYDTGVRWSKWVGLAKYKSETLVWNDVPSVIPAGAKTFGIRIEVASVDKNNKIKVNSSSVEYAFAGPGV